MKLSNTKMNLALTASFLSMLLAGAAIAQHGSHDHAKSDQDQKHAEHREAGDNERIGDPYPLTIDVVTGASLVNVDKPVVFLLDGREFRFGDEKSLKTFQGHTEEFVAKADKMIIEQQTPLYPIETCIVSGGELGGMGEPFNMVYGNRLVRFCCKGCIGKFNKDSEQYLKTLDEAVVKTQKHDYPVSTCVVSGEALGGMGEPIEMVVGNRLIRLCCKGCTKSFEKNPAKFISMLEHPEEHDEQGASHGSEQGSSHDGHGNGG